MWTGLVWHRIGTGGRPLWILYWTFGFHEMLGNYRVASRVVLSSIRVSFAFPAKTNTAYSTPQFGPRGLVREKRLPGRRVKHRPHCRAEVTGSEWRPRVWTPDIHVSLPQSRRCSATETSRLSKEVQQPDCDKNTGHDLSNPQPCFCTVSMKHIRTPDPAGISKH
jgi:hypothetical protein